MRFQPRLNFFRTMNWMFIDNQKNFVFHLFNQPLQKYQKDDILKSFLKNHKTQLASIGNRGNHITTKTLTCSMNHRCAPTQSIRTANGTIRTQSHFITPVNFRLFSSSFLLYGWIFLFQPAFDLFWILFKSTPNRFLWGKTPLFEISANSPN